MKEWRKEIVEEPAGITLDDSPSDEEFEAMGSLDPIDASIEEIMALLFEADPEVYEREIKNAEKEIEAKQRNISDLYERPHRIDVYVGKRIRSLRKLKGLTLEELAKQIGVQFQQLQKYESAANRISASRLYLVCEALGVSLSEFFEEFYPSRKCDIVEMMQSTKGAKLATMFFKMDSISQDRFLAVAKGIVDNSESHKKTPMRREQSAG